MSITFKKRQKEMKRLEKRREKEERRAQKKLAKRTENEASRQNESEPVKSDVSLDSRSLNETGEAAP